MKASNINSATDNYHLKRTKRVGRNRHTIEGNEYFVSTYEFTEKYWGEAKSDHSSKTLLEEILRGEREASQFGGSLNLKTDDDSDPYSFFYHYDRLHRTHFDEQLAVRRNFPFLSLLDTFGTELNFCRFLSNSIRQTQSRFMSNRFIDYEQCEEKLAHNHSKHKSISIFSFISLSAEDGTSAIFNFDDIRSLEELNNISGYSVEPVMDGKF
jgi:hypothetical protein